MIIEKIAPPAFADTPQVALKRGPALRSWAIYGGILLVLIGVLFYRIASLPTPPPRVKSAAELKHAQDARDMLQMARTVEYCEDQYKEMNADRQYSPAALRIHSMACRQLRDDYRARWGQDP